MTPRPKTQLEASCRAVLAFVTGQKRGRAFHIRPLMSAVVVHRFR